MKSYYAAVCEDEEKIMHYLVRKLTRDFQDTGFPLTIEGYCSGKELLTSITHGSKYDILFLDIEMPELNGIELCKKIRQINSDVLIIFISNKEELVFQTFEVRPFRFIRKNYFKKEIAQLIVDIQQEFVRQKGHILTFHEQNSKNIYSLNVNDLIYAEVMGKYCNLVTGSRTITLRYTISDLENSLADYGFLRPHRSYLVNYRYIYNIGSNSVILDDQTEIPLSKKRTDETKKQFLLLSQKEL